MAAASCRDSREVGTGANRVPMSPTGAQTWSQDGSWIAFERVSAPTTGIYKVHADGSGLTQMISDSAPANNYGGLVWSPNGSKFAFCAMNTSNYHMELFTLEHGRTPVRPRFRTSRMT